MLTFSFERGAPYNNGGHALNLYLGIQTYCMPPGLNFTETAASLSRQYKESRPTDSHIRALRHYVEISGPQMLASPPPDWAPFSEPIFSSLGIIDRYFKGTYNAPNGQPRIEVENFRMTGVTCTRQIPIHLFTWQVGLSISYGLHAPLMPCLSRFPEQLQRLWQSISKSALQHLTWYLIVLVGTYASYSRL